MQKRGNKTTHGTGSTATKKAEGDRKGGENSEKKTKVRMENKQRELIIRNKFNSIITIF